MLPLAAGLALCETFSQLGLSGHRLRWPNDIMVGPAKLAGILVERIRPETAVVGIGINLTNRPETADPALAGTVARLADLLASPPSLSTLRDLVLVEIVRAHSMLAADKPELLVSGLEHYWRPIPVRVSIREGCADLEGRFAGVDRAGRVLLATPSGQLAFAAHEVELLREISLSSDFP
jgi:BirA family biotin operon repressor/biotin-[acetyl-CoA-carboxylase] ligase